MLRLSANSDEAASIAIRAYERVRAEFDIASTASALADRCIEAAAGRGARERG